MRAGCSGKYLDGVNNRGMEEITEEILLNIITMMK
jgi:hypothetical protein